MDYGDSVKDNLDGVEGVRGDQDPPRNNENATTSNNPSNWSRFKLGQEDAESGKKKKITQNPAGVSSV